MAIQFFRLMYFVERDVEDSTFTAIWQC